MPIDELGYTVDAAAERLGISRRSIYTLNRDGQLGYDTYPAIGRRITEAHLQAFLDAHRTTTDRATA